MVPRTNGFNGGSDGAIRGISAILIQSSLGGGKMPNAEREKKPTKKAKRYSWEDTGERIEDTHMKFETDGSGTVQPVKRKLKRHKRK